MLNERTQRTSAHIHRHRQLIKILGGGFFQVNTQPDGELVHNIEVEESIIKLVEFAAAEFFAVLLQQVEFGGRQIVDTAGIHPFFESAFGGFECVFQDIQVAGGFTQDAALHLDMIYGKFDFLFNLEIVFFDRVVLFADVCIELIGMNSSMKLS